ncbi:tyrosine-type recombinase/integrase [Aeromonas hydrophila]|uniref:tyrosine-type recombinase/integrase n=1 Tax=Aeromonas hydrophila TaxID=644 RepID=UPI002891DF6A|nr:site-specific integrase [Aeromonas hydrophila]HDX8450731.1 site-specific integrase [Aeromonas hydrophila]
MSDLPSRFRFTQKAIEALPPNPANAKSTEAEYSDTQISGLKCLVGKGEGNKKFLMRYLWHGRKRAIAIGRFPDVDLNTAREIATEYKRLLSQGIDPKQLKEDKRQELTLHELFQLHYLPYAKHHKRSWQNDEQRFRDHLQPALGSRLLSEINLEQGQALQTSLMSKCKPATNNRITTLLKAILTWSVRMGYLQQHPLVYLKTLPENNQRTRFLDKAEIRRLFMAADADENRYAGQYVKLLLLTGLRKDELRLAKWEHIDKVHQTLFIPHTKNGKSRILHMNHMAMQVLQDTPVIAGNPYLFPGQKLGQPLNNVTKPFNRMLKRAQIEGQVCIHTCRHSVAALIVSSGGTLYDVQAQLGHSSSQSSQRYAHLHASRLRHTSAQVANCVEQALIAPSSVKAESIALQRAG